MVASLHVPRSRVALLEYVTPARFNEHRLQAKNDLLVLDSRDLRTLRAVVAVEMLLKPWAAMISATLNPVLSKGVVSEALEFAFSTDAPPTAGSTRGTIPLSSVVAGREALVHALGRAPT